MRESTAYQEWLAFWRAVDRYRAQQGLGPFPGFIEELPTRQDAAATSEFTERTDHA